MSMKVLQMNIDNKNRGGAFILIKQFEKNLLKDGIVFDYLTMDQYTSDGLEKGSRAYSANLRKNRIFGHILLPFFVYRTLKENQYSIVHINSDSSWKAWLYAYPAKKAGVKKVIVHSHSIGSDGKAKWLKDTLHKMFVNKLDKVTDFRLACSEEAARWMFPKDKVSSTNVLFNGIEIDNFQYDENSGKRIREELGVKDKHILGQVGLVSSTKNQIFSIRVLAEYKKIHPDTALLIVGDCNSEWNKKLMAEAKRLRVENDVIIYGPSSEIASILSSMDVFLFPSLFEGAGISLVEAQASGLPCVVSKSVPRITTVSDWAIRLDLSAGATVWATEVEELLNQQTVDRKDRTLDRKYDISTATSHLKKIYIGEFG